MRAVLSVLSLGIILVSTPTFAGKKCPVLLSHRSETAPDFYTAPYQPKASNGIGARFQESQQSAQDSVGPQFQDSNPSEDGAIEPLF